MIDIENQFSVFLQVAVLHKFYSIDIKNVLIIQMTGFMFLKFMRLFTFNACID